MRGFRSAGRATIRRLGIRAWRSAAWFDLIDKVVGDLESEISDGAAALGDIADRAGEADPLERDRVKAQEGGGFTLGIVLVKREAVILSDLPPQGFVAGQDIGFRMHTARYDPPPGSKASSLPRQPSVR